MMSKQLWERWSGHDAFVVALDIRILAGHIFTRRKVRA